MKAQVTVLVYPGLIIPDPTLWVVFAACVTAVCTITFLYTICKLSRLEKIMSETQDAVDAVSAQLSKAQAEIVAEIAALEAQVEAGETPDLTALKAAAQALDDVVPDAVPGTGTRA